jgi:Spy/CpxP family protein refolding chaperone
MKRPAWSVALALALVFLSGVLAGALGDHYLAGPKHQPTLEEYRQAWIKEMRTRLKLDEQQIHKLDEILDATRQKFHDLRERQKPEMKALQDAQTAEINAILSPAQRTEFEKMRKEREAERKRKGPPR